ncbi:CDP-glycerol glycerophosphotransferase family protein [Staphylococcus chromogenes]|uniref:CDP-glycerol glycerophosphotransferase family protein n=1 Tax=Staphylococcus chromogenes TaxID=46126 RepID=UPI002DBC006E|nr:CDP-glycerol glycerophosphotransferase family protein [Staphylococcus chromogenes]MEB7451085.1 CDP-glycerol glycerophosphotransferase family protein [Staphylococcus chromogenes]
MKVNILGFNIFSKGGTSRSNINLILSLLEEGNQVTYFNELPFDEDSITELMIYENIYSENLQIKNFKSDKELSLGDYLIITRETLFKHAQNAKYYNRKIKVIGEIHGPLKYLPFNFEEYLIYIDVVRVSTESIKLKFKEMYNYDNVFNLYVNTRHILINNEPSNTRRNLLIKSRFEDNIKDISYAISLVNYVAKNNPEIDIHLYLIGYAPSELMYKNLVRYYNLENYVHINEKEPKNYIYLSTSSYETLGYSILEAISSGNKALIYPGNDNVLKSIYNSYEGVAFLTKNVTKDADILLDFLRKRYTKDMRANDINILKNDFKISNYASRFLSNVDSLIKVVENKNYLKKVRKRRRDKDKDRYYAWYSLLRNKWFFKTIFQNSYVKKYLTNYYTYRLNKYNEKIEPLKDYIFIESFHGNNFSGDPKYIGLAIKSKFPEKQIFVSSKNSLVDMEIRYFGFTPVRLGTPFYKEAFKKSKYIIVNGNTLDKVGKSSKQIVVQTWHGLPLKKMVGSLNDKEERDKQLSAFLPRMKKWDYLITSSHVNLRLLKSAFKLNENPTLKYLNEGSPRNSYLINNYTEKEKSKIQLKYFHYQNTKKQYILFCPTWRKNKRLSVSEINLKKLLLYLPESIDIIVKLHPNESHLRYKYSNLDERIHCFYNELVDIQELYIISDWMITDYSSTIFDYAHLNKPIFLLNEDESEYRKSIGFNFDIHKLGYFPIANNDEEKLANQIMKLRKINYSKLIERLMSKDNSLSDIKVVENIIR